MARPGTRPRDLDGAASPTLRSARAARPAGAGMGADHDVLELLRVAVLHVPLPAGAVGTVHPRLRLLRVAAHCVVDAGRRDALSGQAGLGSDHLGRALRLDPEVVDRAGL